MISLSSIWWIYGLQKGRVSLRSKTLLFYRLKFEINTSRCSKYLAGLCVKRKQNNTSTRVIFEKAVSQSHCFAVVWAFFGIRVFGYYILYG